jgi:TolB-like protein
VKKLRFIWIGILLSLITGGTLFAQNMTIDEAVSAAARTIEDRLQQGIMVVVLNVNSPSVRLSNYIIDEMMTELVGVGKVQVVDRAHLELIRQEMDFQLSGDVSDRSAQQIGQLLGAQSIISGSIEDMGASHRLRFRVIAVETAAVQAMTSHNVRNDVHLTNLMRDAPAAARSQSQTQHPRGLNYSTGYKIGMGFLNYAFGLGSFIMGDAIGGIINGGTQALGVILMTVAFFAEEVYDPIGGYYYYEPDFTMLAVGLAAGFVSTIHGFVRPFTYDRRLAQRRGTYLGFDNFNPLEHITIMPVASRNGQMNMGLFFSGSY